MIMFGVKLLDVPEIKDLSGGDVFTLMAHARHVAGTYWIFEGDVESLDIDGIRVVSDGETEGHGDMDDKELVAHCEDIFGVELSGMPPSWKMLSDRRSTLMGNRLAEYSESKKCE